MTRLSRSWADSRRQTAGARPASKMAMSLLQAPAAAADAACTAGACSAGPSALRETTGLSALRAATGLATAGTARRLVDEQERPFVVMVAPLVKPDRLVLALAADAHDPSRDATAAERATLPGRCA